MILSVVKSSPSLEWMDVLFIRLFRVEIVTVVTTWIYQRTLLCGRGGEPWQVPACNDNEGLRDFSPIARFSPMTMPNTSHRLGAK